MARLRRQDLRNDEFMIHAARAQRWIQDHSYVAIGALVGVLLLVLIVGAIQRRATRSHHEAAEAYAACNIDFTRGNFQSAALRLENFLAQHPKTPFTSEALLEAASSHLILGNVSDARGLYERFLAKKERDPFMVRAARHGLASCDAAEGKPGPAAQALEALAAQATSEGEKRFHLEEAARFYRVAGDFAKATAILEQLDSQGSQMAQDPSLAVRIRELQAKQHLLADRDQPFTVSPLSPAPAIAPAS